MDGLVFEFDYVLFVGFYLILLKYGMIIGEFVFLFNKEFYIGVDFIVVKMKCWKWMMMIEDIDLLFVFFLLNILILDSIFVYLVIGLIEGINVFEGRGMMKLFEFIGVFYMKSIEFEECFNSFKFFGVIFRVVLFIFSFFKY